ncbi:DUF3090 domain-containing protein [Arthrobacter sp. MYb213]|uniref:DUF3090 domain-containing protein n=1 Tax=Arthrobacter sp. MYb213 TaxID=1848595 RepID=UPI000CFD3B57|nr:DUF3090 domain-containing protein [Arthrobacter sp. MYb213]PRB71273.1 hypothetical protein CQ011_05030 [Arthrobacter sp. MYb213]
MPTRIHEFSWPDRVVVGVIGLPGDRTFYLQVRTGKEIVSVVLEKQQAAQLAENIDDILDQLLTVDGNPFSIPTGTPIELVDNDPLEVDQEQFRTGAMSLGWDPSTSQIVIEAHPIPDEDPDVAPVEETEMLRVRMPVGTARAFAKRTREIVDAGRPMCTLCGYPMDADGHTCTITEN